MVKPRGKEALVIREAHTGYRPVTGECRISPCFLYPASLSRRISGLGQCRRSLISILSPLVRPNFRKCEYLALGNVRRRTAYYIRKFSWSWPFPRSLRWDNVPRIVLRNLNHVNRIYTYPCFIHHTSRLFKLSQAMNLRSYRRSIGVLFCSVHHASKRWHIQTESWIRGSKIWDSASVSPSPCTFCLHTLE